MSGVAHNDSPGCQCTSCFFERELLADEETNPSIPAPPPVDQPLYMVSMRVVTWVRADDEQTALAIAEHQASMDFVISPVFDGIEAAVMEPCIAVERVEVVDDVPFAEAS